MATLFAPALTTFLLFFAVVFNGLLSFDSFDRVVLGAGFGALFLADLAFLVAFPSLLALAVFAAGLDFIVELFLATTFFFLAGVGVVLLLLTEAALTFLVGVLDLDFIPSTGFLATAFGLAKLLGFLDIFERAVGVLDLFRLALLGGAGLEVEARLIGVLEATFFCLRANCLVGIDEDVFDRRAGVLDLLVLVAVGLAGGFVSGFEDSTDSTTSFSLEIDLLFFAGSSIFLETEGFGVGVTLTASVII